MQWTQAHAQIEAILFAAGEAVPLVRLMELLETTPEETERLCGDLMDDYRFTRRGLRLVRLDESYQLLTAPEYAEAIRAILEERRPDRLSRAALEVLSIVAYYQPVTKTYIEEVRGLDSSYTLGILLERALIEVCGKLELPGRPLLYRSTQGFLRAFGIASIDELPELPALEPSTQEKQEKGSEQA